MLAEILLSFYFGLSVPALVSHSFSAEAIGVDLLSFKEVCVDALVYGFFAFLLAAAVHKKVLSKKAAFLFVVTAAIALIGVGNYLAR